MTPRQKLTASLITGQRPDSLHWRRQLVADGFIVDFYCHAAGLVVEVDGGAHETQAEYGAERDAIIRGRDLLVMCVTNADVEARYPQALVRIRQVARRRMRRPFFPDSQGLPRKGDANTAS